MNFNESVELFKQVAIMKVELQTGKKQQMESHYVNAPVTYVVEENFEGRFHDHNDLALAQTLPDQFNVVKTSSSTTMGDRDGRLLRHESSSQTVNVDSQLLMDEAYARELQELENQLSYTSLNRTSGTRTAYSDSSLLGKNKEVVRAESCTSGSKATNQVDEQDDVEPDNMTYEELQSLGEVIGAESRGLSDELISYLPTSTYKTSLFSKREKNEECVICYMAYKNRDKLITLPCQHQYHQGCVSHWLKINKACPVCNVEVFGS